MPSFSTCQHIRENGAFCGSPALQEHDRCYYHVQAEIRQRRAAQSRYQPASIELPLLEDAAAIQAGLQQVLQAVADDRIDARRAGLLLYGLQIASSNLKRHERIMQPLGEPVCQQPPAGEPSYVGDESAEPQPETPSADYLAYRKAFRRVLQLGDELREKKTCGAPLPKRVERRDQAALDEAFLEMKVLEARVKQEREQASMRVAAKAKVAREMAEEERVAAGTLNGEPDVAAASNPESVADEARTASTITADGDALPAKKSPQPASVDNEPTASARRTAS